MTVRPLQALVGIGKGLGAPEHLAGLGVGLFKQVLDLADQLRERPPWDGMDTSSSNTSGALHPTAGYNASSARHVKISGGGHGGGYGVPVMGGWGMNSATERR
jgi:hypothetical protein